MGFRLCFSFIIGRKTLAQQAKSSILFWFGRIGAPRGERLHSIVTLKRRFLSVLALLQCFNRFAASLVSGAHTIQLDSTVEAQLVNFFLRWYIRKFACCAAFGIHRAVYFTKTLEAMFAASVSAKIGGLCYKCTFQLQRVYAKIELCTM